MKSSLTILIICFASQSLANLAVSCFKFCQKIDFYSTNNNQGNPNYLERVKRNGLTCPHAEAVCIRRGPDGENGPRGDKGDVGETGRQGRQGYCGT